MSNHLLDSAPFLCIKIEECIPKKHLPLFVAREDIDVILQNGSGILLKAGRNEISCLLNHTFFGVTQENIADSSIFPQSL